MSRLKIGLPTQFHFKTTINVRISDINYGGHLGNDSVLAIAHEARLRFLKSMGFTELDCAGVGIIMADAQVIYKSEAYYGDELTIEVSCNDIAAIGCDFYYLITNCKTGKEVAHVKTGILFFDYATHKLAKTPPRFEEAINLLIK